MDAQLERVVDQYADEPREDSPDSPQMPFPTSYQLTREQEDELVDHAMKRLLELEQESGRNRTGAGDWWLQDGHDAEDNDPLGTNRRERTWMGKRRLYDLVAQNDVEHRAHVLDGIFADSNLVVPMCRRIQRQMTARATNYFFGTDPWFAVYPVGELDRERADKADRYTRWKLEQAKLKRELVLSIERAFILGESVVKTTWKRREQIYKTLATVLVDEQGLDILGVDGDFILESDLWVTRQVQDEQTGETQEDSALVLKRDGQTAQPANPIWETKPITRRLTQYNGPEASVVHFLDFLCPKDARTIQEADCIVHLYDMSVMSMADQWKKQEKDGADTAEGIAGTKKAIEMIRDLANTGPEPKNAQNSVNPGIGEEKISNQWSRGEPVASICEFHLRYDADGDGIMEEIMLVVDRNSKRPIFYDYEANVTPDGTRPFSVVRANEVPGRWYGIGAMEMFETLQQIVDLTVNRWNMGQSRAARVDFWRPYNTLEGRSNPHLGINWGGTYTPAPGKKAEDCLESVYLENNTGAELQGFLEFWMQLGTNESGVANANDGEAVGLDSAKLATGIRNIEKSGQELFSLHLGHLEPGVEDATDKMVKLLFVNLDQMEVYQYFEEGEGGEGAEDLLAIDPADISDMEINTKVLLTRYRGEQILEGSIRAVELVEKYYAQPYEIQVITISLYREMLKALQVSNANKIIVPTRIMPTNPAGPNPGTLSAGAAPKPRQATPSL